MQLVEYERRITTLLAADPVHESSLSLMERRSGTQDGYMVQVLLNSNNRIALVVCELVLKLSRVEMLDSARQTRIRVTAAKG